MKIVLDTNVLISALLSPSGPPAQILNLVIEGKVKLIIDNRIYLEYSNVLHRKKFNFKQESINPLLDFIRMESETIMAEPLNIEFNDEDDLVFYEVAKSGNALYIVTGNTKHFPNEKMIITPSEFLKIYLSQKDQK
ncbi:MAG: putative toxin-antitoxin system toxin component, PIN family [Spirochaetales bacterium]|nr:putative toxin-antitoxin system toxin component, PIN family [Spirochaetales bacterium]